MRDDGDGGDEVGDDGDFVVMCGGGWDVGFWD